MHWLIEEVEKLAKELPGEFTYVLDMGEEWSGECKEGTRHLTVVLSTDMSLEEAHYLLLHEYAHAMTGESGHNKKLYRYLIPLAAQKGIRYQTILKMEDGEWWDAALYS